MSSHAGKGAVMSSFLKKATVVRKAFSSVPDNLSACHFIGASPTPANRASGADDVTPAIHGHSAGNGSPACRGGFGGSLGLLGVFAASRRA